MPICKKSEFMLCQVCQQEDKQTTFKMLCLAIEFKYQQAFSKIADYTFNCCDLGGNIAKKKSMGHDTQVM